MTKKIKMRCAAIKKNNAYHIAYETDQTEHKKIKEGGWVFLTIEHPGKDRVWEQLCMYKGALKVTVDNTDNEKYNTTAKLDMLLKIKHGFIADSVIFRGGIQFIPKSLSYATAKHKEATEFIAAAMETMAIDILKISVKELKSMLRKK